MIELSEELKQRKEEWRNLGFLLPIKEGKESPSTTFDFLGRRWLFEFRTANHGGWDDFMANGTIHAHSLALRKVRYLSDGELLVAKQIVFFKWVLSWASWNLKTGER